MMQMQNAASAPGRLPGCLSSSMQPPPVHLPQLCSSSAAEGGSSRIGPGRLADRRRLQRHRQHPRLTCGSQGGGDKGGDKGRENKEDAAINKPAGPDFSAYWSNKVCATSVFDLLGIRGLVCSMQAG